MLKENKLIIKKIKIELIKLSPCKVYHSLRNFDNVITPFHKNVNIMKNMFST